MIHVHVEVVKNIRNVAEGDNVDSKPTLPNTALINTVVSGCVATSTNPF